MEIWRIFSLLHEERVRLDGFAVGCAHYHPNRASIVECYAMCMSSNCLTWVDIRAILRACDLCWWLFVYSMSPLLFESITEFSWWVNVYAVKLVDCDYLLFISTYDDEFR